MRECGSAGKKTGKVREEKCGSTVRERGYNAGRKMREPRSFVVLYADDILVIAPSVSELQELFDACAIGRLASEEVILELVKNKCMPCLLYGLECFTLPKKFFEIDRLCCRTIPNEII